MDERFIRILPSAFCKMVHTVIMPKLGQTVEESTILKWHKKTGDQVKKGEILFDIETDKAVLEVESFVEGTLLKILVREGETVPVMVETRKFIVRSVEGGARVWRTQ